MEDVDPAVRTMGIAFHLGSGVSDVFTLLNLSPDDYELIREGLEDAMLLRQRDREALADEVVGLLVGARRKLEE